MKQRPGSYLIVDNTEYQHYVVDIGGKDFTITGTTQMITLFEALRPLVQYSGKDLRKAVIDLVKMGNLQRDNPYDDKKIDVIVAFIVQAVVRLEILWSSLAGAGVLMYEKGPANPVPCLAFKPLQDPLGLQKELYAFLNLESVHPGHIARRHMNAKIPTDLAQMRN